MNTDVSACYYYYSAYFLKGHDPGIAAAHFFVLSFYVRLFWHQVQIDKGSFPPEQFLRMHKKKLERKERTKKRGTKKYFSSSQGPLLFCSRDIFVMQGIINDSKRETTLFSRNFEEKEKYHFLRNFSDVDLSLPHFRNQLREKTIFLFSSVRTAGP